MKSLTLFIWKAVLTVRHSATRHVTDLIRLERVKEQLAATRKITVN